VKLARQAHQAQLAHRDRQAHQVQIHIMIVNA
jgi:hypothetical protein